MKKLLIVFLFCMVQLVSGARGNEEPEIQETSFMAPSHEDQGLSAEQLAKLHQDQADHEAPVVGGRNVGGGKKPEVSSSVLRDSTSDDLQGPVEYPDDGDQEAEELADDEEYDDGPEEVDDFNPDDYLTQTPPAGFHFESVEQPDGTYRNEIMADRVDISQTEDGKGVVIDLRYNNGGKFWTDIQSATPKVKKGLVTQILKGGLKQFVRGLRRLANAFNFKSSEDPIVIYNGFKDDSIMQNRLMGKIIGWGQKIVQGFNIRFNSKEQKVTISRPGGSADSMSVEDFALAEQVLPLSNAVWMQRDGESVMTGIDGYFDPTLEVAGSFEQLDPVTQQMIENTFYRMAQELSPSFEGKQIAPQILKSLGISYKDLKGKQKKARLKQFVTMTRTQRQNFLEQVQQQVLAKGLGIGTLAREN